MKKSTRSVGFARVTGAHPLMSTLRRGKRRSSRTTPANAPATDDSEVGLQKIKPEAKTAPNTKKEEKEAGAQAYRERTPGIIRFHWTSNIAHGTLLVRV